MSGARGRGRTNFVMRKIFHSIANRAAALFMKLLFGYSSRIYVTGSEHVNRAGGFLLASNHISHFDPFFVSSAARRSIRTGAHRRRSNRAARDSRNLSTLRETKLAAASANAKLDRFRQSHIA